MRLSTSRFTTATFLVLSTFGLINCSRIVSLKPVDSKTGIQHLRKVNVSAVNEDGVGFKEPFCDPTQCSQLGVNYFELFIRYLPNGSGYDGSLGSQKVFREMGRKALRDLVHNGIRTIRFSASGYGPNLLADWEVQSSILYTWQKNPEKFWEAQDAMYADLNLLGLKVVPTLNWSLTAFPALTNSTIGDLLLNPNSAASKLQDEYFRQYVTRYKYNPAILYWELHNESNLSSDLDIVSRCRNQFFNAQERHENCDILTNHTNRQLIDYGRRMANLIRSIDNSHPISGGYGTPRPNAIHMANRPEFSGSGADWTADSYSEFVRALREQNEPFDVMSVHIYPVDSDRKSRPFLRSSNIDDAEIMDRLADASAEIGKPIYIGELGHEHSGIGNTPPRFMTSVVEKTKSRRLGLASLWVWEFYQFETYLHSSNADRDFFLIEPGFTDSLISQIHRVNRESGAAPADNSTPDVLAPEVVISWPFPATDYANLSDRKFMHVLASDNTLSALRVEFFVNEKAAGALSAPPYHLPIDEKLVKAGSNEIRIVATDSAGNRRIVRSIFNNGNAPEVHSLSLTANGEKELTVDSGKSIVYSWEADSVFANLQSEYELDVAICGLEKTGIWHANTPNGTFTETISECMSGHSMKIRFYGEHNGQLQEDTVTVKINKKIVPPNEDDFSEPPKISNAGSGCEDPCHCSWMIGERFPISKNIEITIRKADWTELGKATEISRSNSSTLSLVIPDWAQDAYKNDGIRFTVADTSKLDLGFWDTSEVIRCR